MTLLLDDTNRKVSDLEEKYRELCTYFVDNPEETASDVFCSRINEFLEVFDSSNTII